MTNIIKRIERLVHTYEYIEANLMRAQENGNIKNPSLKAIHSYKMELTDLEINASELCANPAEAAAFAAYVKVLRRDVKTSGYYDEIKPDIILLLKRIGFNVQNIIEYMNQMDKREETFKAKTTHEDEIDLERDWAMFVDENPNEFNDFLDSVTDENGYVDLGSEIFEEKSPWTLKGVLQ